MHGHFADLLPHCGSADRRQRPVCSTLCALGFPSPQGTGSCIHFPVTAAGSPIHSIHGRSIRERELVVAVAIGVAAIESEQPYGSRNESRNSRGVHGSIASTGAKTAAVRNHWSGNPRRIHRDLEGERVLIQSVWLLQRESTQTKRCLASSIVFVAVWRRLNSFKSYYVPPLVGARRVEVSLDLIFTLIIHDMNFGKTAP
jgi:hypothetical protein